MHGLEKIYLHNAAVKSIPATGQRRDMLLKALRKIQVTPQDGGDFIWPLSQLEQQVNVTVVVGYAISWIFKNDTVHVLDIRGQ